LAFLGFGQSWRNWISAMWATSSSTFLVNGVPCRRRVFHRRGVRQGDPISPMLFLLAIAPLHMLFQHAQNTGELSFLHKNCKRFKMSLHTDDAMMFINPTTQDLSFTKHLLHQFGEAMGLITNLEKTKIFPIRCH
jgi:hypothetical protein